VYWIALFPCYYTDEAALIGESCYLLNERICTDEMLLDDVSRHFSLSRAELKKILFGAHKQSPRHIATKNKYLNLLKLSIEMRLLENREVFVHYGLHTSLLPVNSIAFAKFLVVDDLQTRIKRAVQLEGFSKEKTAKLHIARKDKTAKHWTHFLLGTDPYDESLHDIIIPCAGKKTTDIARMIIAGAERQGRQEYKNLAENHRQPAPHSQDLWL
jgi:cytidylate kinase